MSKCFNVGIVGCGNISPAYFRGCAAYSNLQVTACADLNPDAAAKRAADHGVRATSIDSLLADPEIDIVINLTIPAAHAEVSIAALRAGKHVYVEKPLADNVTAGREVMAVSAETGFRVGCAPDTVLGQAVQSCRKLIDDGRIGEVTGANAFMLSGGPESWHPNPSFFYRFGGGPLFDMGPYYLTALVTLLGPVASVTAAGRRALDVRPSKHGGDLGVEIPTHLAGLVEFGGGVIATATFSFDVFAGTQCPNIEIYGTQGTLSVPDPNRFEGEIVMRRHGEKDWNAVEPLLSHVGTRGLGVADMAQSIEDGVAHRASGSLGLHVLETMESFLLSRERQARVEIESPCERPSALSEVPGGVVPEPVAP